MSRITFIRPEGGLTVDTAPPIGLCYLASMLRKTEGIDSVIYDERAEKRGRIDVLELLKRDPPDIVGISAFTYERSQVRNLSGKLKSMFPRVKVIVGGPIASADPESLLDLGPVDAAVIGEADHIIGTLVRHLIEGKDLQGLDGVCSKDESAKIQVRRGKYYPEDLDSLPLPAWDLLDFKRYELIPRQGLLYKYKPYAPIFTSRGCPFHCIYCHNIFGRKFRAHSPERVVREIGDLVVRYGIREIQVLDDIFNFDQDRAKAIFKGIIDKGFPIALSFPSGLRGDMLDDETIDLMAKAGTYKVSIALESGSPRIQKQMRKNLNLKKTRDTVDKLAERNILTHLFCMLGFPTETIEEAKETVRFATETNAHSASFFMVNPFPGTELGNRLKALGRPDASSLDTSSYWDPKIAGLGVSEMSPDALRNITASASKIFYLRRPMRLLRILRDIPNKRQIFSGAIWVFVRSFIPSITRFERFFWLGRKTKTD